MALYFGGLPTKMDVDRLFAKFNLDVGAQLSYDDVGAAAGADPKSSRFKTVTSVWRRRAFRERGIRIVAEGGFFRVLTPDEAHDYSRSDMRRAGRAAGRAVANVEAVDASKLSTERRDVHNLMRRKAQAILEQHRKSAKLISAPKAVSAANLRVAK